MGWFNSIIQGAGSAVTWAVNNAGTIKDLFNTIFIVSQLGEEPSTRLKRGPDSKAEIFQNYKDSEDYMIKKAKEALRHTFEEKQKKGWDPPKKRYSDTGLVTALSGVWTGPSSFNDQDDELPEMYRDIAKMLAENDLPTVIKKDKEEKDLAEYIAQVIFSNDPTPPSLVSTLDEDDPAVFPRPTFADRDDDNTYQIYCSHAYYAIPMGKGAPENVWHGAICLKALVASDLTKKEVEEFKFMSTIEPSALDAWLVTLQFSWKTVKLARRAYKTLKAHLNKKDPDKDPKQGFEVTYNFLDSQVQTVKITTPTGASPSKTRYFLQEAVAQSLVLLDTPGIPSDELKRGQEQLKHRKLWSKMQPPFLQAQRIFCVCDFHQRPKRVANKLSSCSGIII